MVQVHLTMKVKLVEKCDVDGSTTASTPEMLRKIVKNADGTVKFTPVDASAYKASAADSLSGNKVVLNKNTYYLADDVQIYIYDTSDNTYDVDGVSSDLIDDANTYVRLYTTAKADSDNAGLVTYVVITRA